MAVGPCTVTLGLTDDLDAEPLLCGMEHPTPFSSAQSFWDVVREFDGQLWPLRVIRAGPTGSILGCLLGRPLHPIKSAVRWKLWMVWRRDGIQCQVRLIGSLAVQPSPITPPHVTVRVLQLYIGLRTPGNTSLPPIGPFQDDSVP